MSGKRSELERSGADAVQRSGLSNLSFRALAERAGIKSSSVHYYFPEKSDLAGALIDKYMQQFQVALAEIDAKEAEPKQRLAAFFKIFEDTLQDDKLCLCGMLAAEVNSLGPANRERLELYFRCAEDWLCSVFQACTDSLSPSLSPERLARVVMSGLEGAILLDRVGRGQERLRAQKEFIRAIID